MTDLKFMSGIGLGLMAGAALGMVISPKPVKDIKRAADKAMKTVGDAVGDFTDSFGM